MRAKKEIKLKIKELQEDDPLNNDMRIQDKIALLRWVLKRKTPFEKWLKINNKYKK
jgi:hypothetical protein|tara:strand:+ start:151 stop:318 length:168 start_codon:yes stop_codon:yes gene_type:complete